MRPAKVQEAVLTRDTDILTMYGRHGGLSRADKLRASAEALRQFELDRHILCAKSKARQAHEDTHPVDD